MFSNLFLQLLLKIIIFIVIIYTLQCGFEYLKDTYTKPRVRDLVNAQIKKYKEIVSEIHNNTEQLSTKPNDEDGIFNDPVNIEDMNNELLTFMNSHTQQYVTTP